MKKYIINKKRFCLAVLLFALVLFCIIRLVVDVVRFPECYFSTWRYQLQSDIKEGDNTAIDYYETTYIANGIELFKR